MKAISSRFDFELVVSKPTSAFKSSVAVVRDAGSGTPVDRGAVLVCLARVN
jgi:hypothetical protein